MGLFNNWFTIESQETHDRNIEKVNKTIFAYGPEHKAKIKEILAELIDNEYEEIKLFDFMQCKERVLSKDNRIDNHIIYELKKEMVSANKNVFKYMALVEADINVDERLIYPSIEELKDRAKQLDR